MRIDAAPLHYRELNEQIKQAVAKGERQFELVNVCGHRYIGCGVQADVTIKVQGIPGNDLGAFMGGPQIFCSGNAQDGIANTMDEGLIVVPGHVGDVLGYSMRGGRVYVRGNAGYRIGIHMKSFQGKEPIVIIGGRVRDFCGEYMAGGKLVILGLEVPPGEPLVGHYCASGMHGGVIYVRGDVPPSSLRPGIAKEEAEPSDYVLLEKLLTPYCAQFGVNVQEIVKAPFTKLTPQTTRPYGQLYAY